MKRFLKIACFLFLLNVNLHAQTIVGTWQLVDETTCLDETLEPGDEDAESLIEEMRTLSGGTQKVIIFNDNQTGEENIKILGRKKGQKMDSFLYKLDKDKLYLLDKRSRLLVGSYEVETLTSDSLIFSNIKRACEVKVLIRVKEKK